MSKSAAYHQHHSGPAWCLGKWSNISLCEGNSDRGLYPWDKTGKVNFRSGQLEANCFYWSLLTWIDTTAFTSCIAAYHLPQNGSIFSNNEKQEQQLNWRDHLIKLTKIHCPQDPSALCIDVVKQFFKEKEIGTETTQLTNDRPEFWLQSLSPGPHILTPQRLCNHIQFPSQIGPADSLLGLSLNFW